MKQFYQLLVVTFFTFLLGNTSLFAQTGLADDFDGDGRQNQFDIDDDNDGILDTIECEPFVFNLGSIAVGNCITEVTGCTQAIWLQGSPVYYSGSPTDICLSGTGGSTFNVTNGPGNTDPDVFGINCGGAATSGTFLEIINFTTTVSPSNSYELGFNYHIWAAAGSAFVDLTRVAAQVGSDTPVITNSSTIKLFELSARAF